VSKRILSNACLILAVSILIQGCGKKQQSAEKAPMAVVVAPALKKDIQISKEVIGQTKAYDYVELVARVQGFLTKRLFEEGKPVKKGELLFEIEKDQYQADLQSAQASLLKAQAQFDNAEIEYNRNKGLLGKKAIAQREFDSTNLIYMEAKASVMDAEAKVKKAQISLNYTTIESPFDGKIGVAYVSVGNLVGTGTSGDTKLAVIVSTDPMRVQFNISELDLLAFSKRDTVNSFEEAKKDATVKLQFQDGSMYAQTGTLNFVDNRVNPSTGTILVEALFPNKDGNLISGFYVKVIMQSSFTTNAIVIPQSALMEGQAGTSVYVVGKDGSVSLKIVKTGSVKAPYVGITDGLTEGDLVVTEGLQNLGSGMKVSYTYDLAYAADSGRSDIFASKSDTQTATN